ncbi:Phenylacetate-coenzyme A ligase [Gemmata sp. SH-PL17]|uniref:phenylacetate--CoA ligase family protein n=1 Tax=Gemmata sp. SH-PL17 TaxID=1630693 RepID=UPI0004B60D44|nr:AMP-binding protein [Gemmata sp. SH-PL17]AMV26793.1 Phenylacetate-coenzyme A ligase [Gemmata sp. SH-PL17]
MPTVPLDTPADQLRSAQLAAVRRLLAAVIPGNPFYARKFAGRDPREIDSMEAFARLPFTTKAELTANQAEHPPYGSNLTFPIERYTRFHQTSGTTTGRPLHWLDTLESWEWLIGCWHTNFALFGLTQKDRLFFPFSFGPFLGFWSAFEAASRAGFLTMPGGGMTSTGRLRFLLEHHCTVLFATPTYALHLAELAAKEGVDLANSAVRAIVVAGEPGGNIPATRQRLEAVWGARVFDHYGMTEMGPTAVEAAGRPGEMYLLECDYLAEVVNSRTGQPVAEGESGELVLTNLGRVGSPLIRYRTGDMVRVATSPDPTGRSWRRLDGGILGRADDMLHVRGNNLYPSAIEAIVRRFPAVAEYRIHVDHTNPLADLRLEVEPATGDGNSLADNIGRAIRDELFFRVDVTAAAPGSLPRFEMKAARIVRTAR